MKFSFRYTLIALLAVLCFSPQIAALQAADEPEILTPPPAPEPRINGAKVFGVRPGHPVLYTIAATGKRPMKFSMADLPEGLRLDETNGQIRGTLAERGTYRLMVRVENALGHAERELRIVVGDDVLLTPLLGCNTWGGWGPKVSDANLRAAAKAMVDTGLINHGWQYINIDDGWQGHRGGPYNAIQPNEKFPDMKALCDYIHSLGLKAGVYSTPWTTSYAGFIGGSSDDPDGAWERPKNRRDGWRCGKYFFETNDARQWAEWGFDYAKYDWGVDRVELTRRMAEALAACDRDIVLELSNSVPLDKAAEHTSLADLSRTTGDLVDFWDRSQMPEGIRGWAEGVREVWLAHDTWAPYQRPGHWNHACNIRIGLLGGWRDKPLTPTHLTPDEQYTHISLWCLWGSPMIIGTPIERLDPFTLSLLSNDDVLEINQDPMGVQGRRAEAKGGEAVVKPLEDGSKAVGIFNPGEETAKVTIDWKTIGVKGEQQVRDLWRQKDLGVHEETFTTEVKPHGVVLVRLSPAKAADTESAKRWSAEKANAWYARQPWPIGCNYIPSTAINQIETWQAESFDPKTIDRELGLAESIGFNTVRVFSHDLVWGADPGGFKDRVRTFLDLCEKHHIRVIFNFFTNGCYGFEGEAKLGKQPDPVPGIHNSGWVQTPGVASVNDPSKWGRLEKYVKDVITTFRDDDRILLWHLYNEPANTMKGCKSLPLLSKAFEWGRAVNPSQPLSAVLEGRTSDDMAQFLVENSDVITFHSYAGPKTLSEKWLGRLKAYNRPVICTEYMARPRGSTFQAILPIFHRERIGAINFGLVAGKMNTQFPWGSKEGSPEPKVWFHDIFRPDGIPFDPEEIALIEELSGKGK